MIPVMNLAQENVMYTKILVPLDGSESSMRGLSEAIKIAAEHAGEIRLLHVVEVPSPLLDYGYSQGDCRSAVLASLCRVGKNILSKAESAVREHGLTAGCSLFESGSSSTSDIILEQARLWGASLIVMGAHTPSARGRIGRISSDVISESGIPVLMVHGAPTIMTSAGHREVTYDFAPAAEPGA
jgi:nucleotide-binding universal stress UspA family protein